MIGDLLFIREIHSSGFSRTINLSSSLQLLVRLCSHPYPAEELARKDDLTLLFSAITSWCPQYNVMWRKSAAEVLMTLSRHGLTQNVVAYIHSEFDNALLYIC